MVNLQGLKLGLQNNRKLGGRSSEETSTETLCTRMEGTSVFCLERGTKDHGLPEKNVHTGEVKNILESQMQRGSLNPQLRRGEGKTCT